MHFSEILLTDRETDKHGQTRISYFVGGKLSSDTAGKQHSNSNSKYLMTQKRSSTIKIAIIHQSLHLVTKTLQLTYVENVT